MLNFHTNRTLSELAAMLNGGSNPMNVSVDTLRREVVAGRLKGYKDSRTGHFYVYSDEYDRLLREKREHAERMSMARIVADAQFGASSPQEMDEWAKRFGSYPGAPTGDALSAQIRGLIEKGNALAISESDERRRREAFEEEQRRERRARERDNEGGR